MSRLRVAPPTSGCPARGAITAPDPDPGAFRRTSVVGSFQYVGATYIESKRFAHDGQEIKPGARIHHPSRLEQRLLRVTTVVDEVNPDRWHAEVTFLGETLVSTAQFENDTQAVRAAEQAFLARLRDLFNS